MADENNEKEARRKKQVKRMTKILGKAWNGNKAKHFHEAATTIQLSSNIEVDGPLDLSSVGKGLEEGNYAYGRNGWEKFARDMGGVYNRHIARKWKHAASAKEELELVKRLLGKVDPYLSELATSNIPKDTEHQVEKKEEPPPPPISQQSVPKKKRKFNKPKNGTTSPTEILAVPKKKRVTSSSSLTSNTSTTDSASYKEEPHLTITQRESRAVESLETYLEECGGTREQATLFRCKVTHSNSSSDRFVATFYSTQTGRRLRSMMEVARFLNLDTDHNTGKKGVGSESSSPAMGQSSSSTHRKQGSNHYPSKGSSSSLNSSINKKRPRNHREAESERKKLRRELDKLLKNHSKTSKALDDFDALNHSDTLPIDDEDLLKEDGDDCNRLKQVCRNEADVVDYPGIPSECTPNVWMVWDFLCTFHRAISLEPIGLDDFASLLIYGEGAHQQHLIEGEEPPMTPPLFLTEAHLALLKLLLSDVSSDEWWWSTLETEEPVAGEEGIVMDGSTSAAHGKEEAEKESPPDPPDSKNDPDGTSESEEDDDDDDDDDSDYEGGEKDTNHPKTPSSSSTTSTTLSRTSKPQASVVPNASKPVSSAIPLRPPPTCVDLLLPPRKPLPSSDLISPFTWPCLAGAVALRVMHRYKRKRNEVDDSSREFRGLEPISVGERLRREKLGYSRIFSDGVGNTDKGTTEDAIQHLCLGKPYLMLSASQKLSIFRILIEACYDTDRVRKCIEDNIKSRINAVKALDNEERKAKKEAREQAALDERAARERLVLEEQNAFLNKKKREILRTNRYTSKDLDEEVVKREWGEEEVLNYLGKETRLEYEGLRGGKDFNKGEVCAMVARMQEEEAFETNELLVLTLKEIQARDLDTLKAMEKRLSSYTKSISSDDGEETSDKIPRLQNEISTLQQEIETTLPAARIAAIKSLKEAMEDGTLPALRDAIKLAKQARLTGPMISGPSSHSSSSSESEPESNTEDNTGVYALDLLRDAKLELQTAERQQAVTKAKRDLVAKRNRCFVRTEPIGVDRNRALYWRLGGDDDDDIDSKANKEVGSGGRIWVESQFDEEEEENLKGVTMGAPDEEGDLLRNDADNREWFIKFSRQEYHPSGRMSSLVRRPCACHSTDFSLRALIKHLHPRGVQEGALRSTLKEILSSQQQSPDEEHIEKVEETGGDYKSSGDEEIFAKAKSSFDWNGESEDVQSTIEKISSAIDCRVRYLQDIDPDDSSKCVRYQTGTVTGWKIIQSQRQQDQEDHEDFDQETPTTPTPIWRLSLDGGGQYPLDSQTLLQSLVHHLTYPPPPLSSPSPPLPTYRNSLGRFCGRAVDAPHASDPIFLARLLLRREQEFYMPLKSRSYENHWGGKGSGLRNGWIADMKEHGHDFGEVKRGLLVLEEAFFQFCGGGYSNVIGGGDGSGAEDQFVTRTGREMLDDEAYRFDVELESIGQVVTALWNCKETRLIFREIISSSKTVGFLALGLDLLCRNSQAYLDVTKPKTMHSSTAVASGGLVEGRRTRRMNAWQQQHSSF